MPNVQYVPCYRCDDAYLSDPAALMASVNPETGLALIQGCECPGCVSLRSIDTGPAPLTVEAQFECMAPMTVSFGSFGTTPQTFAICPLCVEQVRNAYNDSSAGAVRHQSCGDCGSVNPAMLASFGLSFLREREPMEPNEISFGSRGRMPGSHGRGPRTQFSFLVSDLDSSFAEEGRALCTTCVASGTECDDCDTFLSHPAIYSCDDCERRVCQSCYDRSHSDHQDNSYDRARYNFACRSSVAVALDATGAPGQSVLSTRAIGIEIETSRGTAQTVIDRERSSVVPVLAAVGTDGSVRGRNPVEYRLLPQRGVWVEYSLRNMAQWCREAGYAPDSSAGVHMHVDCGALSASNVWRAFAALVCMEPLLFSHAAAARVSNTYCQRITNPAQVISTAMAEAARRSGFFEPSAAGIVTRYQSINAQSYSAHQTLEVRVFDSAHDEDSVVRYIDAAAIIAGTVDFAVSDEWATFAAGDLTPGPMTSMRLLSALVLNNHVTAETFMRAWSRVEPSAAAPVETPVASSAMPF